MKRNDWFEIALWSRCAAELGLFSPGKGSADDGVLPCIGCSVRALLLFDRLPEHSDWGSTTAFGEVAGGPGRPFPQFFGI